jgi:hypothetical protein
LGKREIRNYINQIGKSMNSLFKKLNFKDQTTILVINHPASFQKELNEMKDVAKIFNDTAKIKTIEFAIAFATKQKEIDSTIKNIAPKLAEDAVIWFCYPKGTSKKYTCEFNRDTGWASVGKFNLEPVRQVAIDEDWSALRFRNVEKIKKITRRKSFALTDQAKKRTTNKGQ